MGVPRGRSRSSGLPQTVASIATLGAVVTLRQVSEE